MKIYKKIHIHVKRTNEEGWFYACSTNWAKTCKEAKDFYHCDKALKVNDMIYFCRKMEVVDIIEEKNNEDGQIQLVEEIQEETAA